MKFDVFISYSRRDNIDEKITDFVEKIKSNYKNDSGKRLKVFFDKKKIFPMDYWQHKIQKGLKESHLFIAFLSPSYLESEYCRWECEDFFKHELGRFCSFECVAPIYFVDIPNWYSNVFDHQCENWIKELRCRQDLDLRPWKEMGEDSLNLEDIDKRMKGLSSQIKDRIKRGQRARRAMGNVNSHNPHFMGRRQELLRIRETVSLGRTGVVTALNGLGGVGKTALVTEYAHAYADQYGGGRWQVSCEGKEHLYAAVAELASSLDVTFSETEKTNTKLQFQKILVKLNDLATSNEEHQALIILDNVDNAKLLNAQDLQELTSREWLHVIATTRLGEAELGEGYDRNYLSVDVIGEEDALNLIKSYHAKGEINDYEIEAAKKIVKLLGSFTLAIESAAVFLAEFKDVTFEDFLERLTHEGASGLDEASDSSQWTLRHGERRLSATLKPTFEMLNEGELLTLEIAAYLPPDTIAIPWLKELVTEAIPELKYERKKGHPDPWHQILRRLKSLRLIQDQVSPTGSGYWPIVRMHRLVQNFIINYRQNYNKSIENLFRKYIINKMDLLEEKEMRDWECKASIDTANYLIDSENRDSVGLRIIYRLSWLLCFTNYRLDLLNLLEKAELKIEILREKENDFKLLNSPLYDVNFYMSFISTVLTGLGGEKNLDRAKNIDNCITINKFNGLDIYTYKLVDDAFKLTRMGGKSNLIKASELYYEALSREESSLCSKINHSSLLNIYIAACLNEINLNSYKNAHELMTRYDEIKSQYGTEDIVNHYIVPMIWAEIYLSYNDIDNSLMAESVLNDACDEIEKFNYSGNSFLEYQLALTYIRLSDTQNYLITELKQTRDIEKLCNNTQKAIDILEKNQLNDQALAIQLCRAYENKAHSLLIKMNKKNIDYACALYEKSYKLYKQEYGPNSEITLKKKNFINSLNDLKRFFIN